MHGRRKEERKRKNDAKFSGHYVCPRTHKVRAHALRSHQIFYLNAVFSRTNGAKVSLDKYSSDLEGGKKSLQIFPFY